MSQPLSFQYSIDPTMGQHVSNVCASHSVSSIDYGECPNFALLCLGSGLGMAVADHLRTVYPGLAFRWFDLPSALNSIQQAVVFDYVASVYPTLYCGWHSLRPATALPQSLIERGFNPRLLWVYVQGIDQHRAKGQWTMLGAQLILSPWGQYPISQHWKQDQWYGQGIVSTVSDSY